MKTEVSNTQPKEQDRTTKETWNTLLGYAGRWCGFIWVSMIAAALSTVAGIVPYTYIHKIIHSILQVNPDINHIIHLAWLVVLFFVISVLL